MWWITSRPMSSILAMSFTPRIEKIVWCDPAAAQLPSRSTSAAGVSEPRLPSGVIEIVARFVLSIVA